MSIKKESAAKPLGKRPGQGLNQRLNNGRMQMKSQKQMLEGPEFLKKMVNFDDQKQVKQVYQGLETLLHRHPGDQSYTQTILLAMLFLNQKMK